MIEGVQVITRPTESYWITGDPVGVGDWLAVGVLVGVRVGVPVAVAVAVCVDVGVYVTGVRVKRGVPRRPGGVG